MTRTATQHEIDDELTSLAFFSNPYPTYERLREEAPVHWCESWGQWVVTRFEDVLAVNRDPARFSSAGWERKFISSLPPELQELPHMQRHYGTKVLSMTDPPEHTRLRRLVVRSFTPRVLEALRPGIESLVHELLDDMRGKTTVDAIADFAYPLPAIVIGRLLGAPDDARDQFMRWSKDIVDFVGTGHADAERALRNEETLREFRAFLEPIIRDRRANPRDDLMSILASPAEDGERLSDDELISTCIVFLFAGHETTANLIGNGLLALLKHPDQLAALRRQPELTATAVEELLRYDSPVQRNRRIATADVELGGGQIGQGDSVLVFMGSANRDPAKFPDPNALDITRSPNQHMAFGHGIHFCVGAALSRIEAPIAIRALLERFPDVRLADGYRENWRHNITFRGLDSLELDLS
ncbi:MAG: cytochrome P450 [Gaiellaceae bacterium]